MPENIPLALTPLVDGVTSYFSLQHSVYWLYVVKVAILLLTESGC